MPQQGDGQKPAIREGAVANDNRPRPSQAPGAGEEHGRPAFPEPAGANRSYLGLLAVIVGVGLLYWLVTVFMDWNKEQTCAGYGMRSCTPRIDLTNH
jgi:hypothetical protein